MLSGLPTLMKNPDTGPLHAHCPAAQPLVGIAFASNASYPMISVKSADVSTAHGSKSPPCPAPGGGGLTTGVGDASAEDGLASADSDGGAVDGGAVATLATGVWLAVTGSLAQAAIPTEDSPITSSTAMDRDTVPRPVGRKREHQRSNSRYVTVALDANSSTSPLSGSRVPAPAPAVDGLHIVGCLTLRVNPFEALEASLSGSDDPAEGVSIVADLHGAALNSARTSEADSADE